MRPVPPGVWASPEPGLLKLRTQLQSRFARGQTRPWSGKCQRRQVGAAAPRELDEGPRGPESDHPPSVCAQAPAGPHLRLFKARQYFDPLLHTPERWAARGWQRNRLHQFATGLHNRF